MVHNSESTILGELKRWVDNLKNRALNTAPQVMMNEFANEQANAREIKLDLDNGLDELKENNKRLPRVISNNQDKRERTLRVKERVGQIIVAIQQNNIQLAPGAGGDMVKKLITDIGHIERITDNTASYIYLVLDRGLNQQLNSVDALIDTARAIENLKYIDDVLYDRIVENFKGEARTRFGLPNNDVRIRELERLKERELKIDVEPSEGSAAWNNRVKRKSEEWDQWYTDTQREISALKPQIEARLRPEIERQVRQNWPNLPAAQQNDEINRTLQREVDQIMANLTRIGSIANVQRSRLDRLREQKDMPTQDSISKEYVGMLNSYLANGFITSPQYENLTRRLSELNDFMKLGIDSYGRRQRYDLYALFENAGVTIPPEDVPYAYLFRALSSGDKQAFMTELRTNPRYNKKRLNLGLPADRINDLSNVDQENYDIDVEEIWKDLKFVCERLIAVIDTRPGEFFDNAFNPLTYGNAYNALIMSMRGMVEMISSEEETRDFLKPKVKLKDFVNPDNPNSATPDESTYSTKKQLTYNVEKIVDLDTALGVTLVTRMDRFLRVNKYLHDVAKIVDEGLGWEQLEKYAEQVNTADIDWYFFDDDDMSTAYQFYVQKLDEQQYTHNRITTTDTGKDDITYSLDHAQRYAFFQLWSIKKNEPDPYQQYLKAGDESEAKFSRKNRLMRKIRLAAGIARGYTGEEWSVLSNTSMPIKERVVIDPGGTSRSEFDPEFTSTSNRGIEKMRTAYDPWMNWRRFNVPAQESRLPYIYVDREYHHGGQYEKMNHAEYYRAQHAYEDAYFRGASNYYLKLFRKKLMLGEAVAKKVCGMFLRNGWRTDQYHKFVYFREDPGNTQYLDFAKTISELMSAGSVAVKQFVESFDHEFETKPLQQGKMDPNRIDNATYQALMGHAKPAHFTQKEVDSLKKKLKKDFLYKRYFDTMPTRVLGFERRLYTPKGEKLIIDDLRQYLVQQFRTIPRDTINQRLTQAFIGALEIAETKKWNTIKDNLQNGFTASCDPRKNGGRILDLAQFRQELNRTILTAADISDVPANEELMRTLESYFEQFKGDNAKIFDYQLGEDILGNISFQQFKNALPGFFNTLHDDIYKKRLEREYTPQEQTDIQARGWNTVVDEIARRAWNRGKWEGVTDVGELKKVAANNHNSLKIELYDRFMEFEKLGLLDSQWGGQDTDFRKFFFQRAGNRPVARYIHETNVVSTEVVTPLTDYLVYLPQALIDGNFKSVEEMEKFVAEKGVPILDKAMKGLTQIDYDWASEWGVRMTQFISRMVRRDDKIGEHDPGIYRFWGLGRLAELAVQYQFARPSSFMQDFLPPKLDRLTKAFDPDWLYALTHTLLRGVKLQPDELNISKAGFKNALGNFLTVPDKYKMREVTLNLFGRQIRRLVPEVEEDGRAKMPIFGWNLWKKYKPVLKEKWKYYAEQVMEAEGLTKKQRFGEWYLPIIMYILLLTLLGIARAASKKESEKR